MPNTSKDPVDHARTTRQHAGETMKNGNNAPGLIAVAVGVIALVIGLFAMATSHAAAATTSIGVAVLVGGAGLVWLAVAHRQVRAAERQWAASHPGARLQPPTS